MALGTANVSNDAFAASIAVPVTLTTDSAITLASVTDMDFGSWLLYHDTTNNVTVTMVPSTGTVTGVSAGGTSVASLITASASVGAITVNSPGAAALDLFGSVTTDFVDAGLALTAITYAFNGGADTALGVNVGAATTINTTGGATLDPLLFGGLVTVTVTPADQAHTATVTVNVQY